MTDGTTNGAAAPDPAVQRSSKLRQRDQAFDAALGARIRAARVAAGMSQGALGQVVGVSFQQVQKYEHGKDRVSAGMLFLFATALNVPISSLYEGTSQHASARPNEPFKPARSGAGDKLSAKIVVLFQQIDDLRIRKRLVELAKMLGEGERP